PLADRRGENRCIDAQKAARVEEIVNGLLDFVPNRKDRPLAAAAKPEMPVVQQEIDSVFLGLNRIIDGAPADDGELRHTNLVPARGTWLGAHVAGNLNRRLERELLETLPDLGREIGVTQLTIVG